jgi:hypothetical protein
MFAPMPEEEADLSLAEFGSHKRPLHFSATRIGKISSVFRTSDKYSSDN